MLAGPSPPQENADRKFLIFPAGVPWTVDQVRAAVRTRNVCFPSQVPSFREVYRADIQWRIVLLYFVRGWTAPQIADRYGIRRKRVLQILRRWTEIAESLGYLCEAVALASPIGDSGQPSELRCGPTEIRSGVHPMTSAGR